MDKYIDLKSKEIFTLKYVNGNEDNFINVNSKEAENLYLVDNIFVCIKSFERNNRIYNIGDLFRTYDSSGYRFTIEDDQNREICENGSPFQKEYLILYKDYIRRINHGN
jgi:hypothetical protein